MTISRVSSIQSKRLLDQKDAQSPILSSSPLYQVPQDDSDRHLIIVVAGTLWWYVYTSFEMFQIPSLNFFGLTSSVVQTLGVYVTLSQLLVYVGCYWLARAETLLQAQKLVVAMTFLCVPADVIATLVNPTDSKGITILAFTEITLFFGTFLAHYLRKASYREIPPSHEKDHSNSDRSMVEALIHYRPPMGIQATHMAADFTRSFVAFTIAAGSVGQLLASSESLDPLALGSLVIVVLHTAAECTLTTVFPGANLNRFDSYLVGEILLYSVHMFAASIATIQTVFGTSLIDQALFIWLFGSATAKVVFKLQALLGKVDLDAKLGLSNLDGSESQ